MPKILDNPREKILNEAALILGEKGYKKLSMREVATRCDIGIGTVYNYFTNKYDLVNEIFLANWKRITNSLLYLKHAEISFQEKMEVIYQGLNEFLLTHMEVFIEINKVEEKNDYCRSERVMEPLYEITDEIVEIHREKKDISIPLETRKITIFIITNMISIIRGKEITFNDLMLVITNKIS